MSDKILSILFRKDGFSFCVLRNGAITHTETVATDSGFSNMQEFRKHLDTVLYFQQDYDRVYAALLTPQFNLVPESIFTQDTEAQKWLEFNTEVFENDIILHSDIGDSGIKLVYALPGDVQQILQSRFKDLKISSAAQIFIQKCLSENSETQMFVYFHPKNLEIVCSRNKQLLFYNLFEVNTREDAVYYILNVSKQLDLDPGVIKLYFFGSVQKETLKMLMNFVRHVIPGTSEPNLLEHYTEIHHIS